MPSTGRDAPLNQQHTGDDARPGLPREDRYLGSYITDRIAKNNFNRVPQARRRTLHQKPRAHHRRPLLGEPKQLVIPVLQAVEYQELIAVTRPGPIEEMHKKRA